jgi:hypothetical protein
MILLIFLQDLEYCTIIFGIGRFCKLIMSFSILFFVELVCVGCILEGLGFNSRVDQQN